MSIYKSLNMEAVFPPKPITLGELVKGYKREVNINYNESVTALSGRLIVRPSFQREFIYNPERQKGVIESIISGYPIGKLYFSQEYKDKEIYELVDGQQRIMSICEFFAEGSGIEYNLQIEGLNGNISAEEIKQTIPDLYAEIMNYELDITICIGDALSKLKWFEIINSQRLEMTKQEMRNANFSGEWLTDAKKYFCRNDLNTNNSMSVMHGEIPLVFPNTNSESSKSFLRQYLLELVLKWKVDEVKNKNDTDYNFKKDLDEITVYMKKHKDDKDAKALKDYWTNVFEWVYSVFDLELIFKKNKRWLSIQDIKQNAENWGYLYNKYKNITKPSLLNEKYGEKLTMDEWLEKLFALASEKENNEITKKSGIWDFIFTADEKFITPRAFSIDDRKQKFIEQKQKCRGYKINCNKKFKEYNEMAADHIIPWSKGGKTTIDNLQLLCFDCNARKSNKTD